MSIHQHAALESTVYFWFAANDTSGSGDDGATAAADVRLAGGGASDAPVLSPSPALLSHANYPAGCYEVAVAATTGNGFAANSTYAVFCTLAVDGQNPTGFIGSFTLTAMATAAALGTMSDAAADGDPTNADTLMAYVKQLINTLVGTAGIPTFPSAAAPGNGVSISEAIRKIYDLLPTVADIFGEVVDDDKTFGDSIRLQNAVAFGKSSGAGTTNPKFRDLADTIDRIDATLDANKNRTAVTLNPTQT